MKNFKLFVQLLIFACSFVSSIMFAITTVFAGIDALICGGDCFENYKGKDYFYSGTEGFVASLALLAVSVIIFIICWKLTPSSKLKAKTV